MGIGEWKAANRRQQGMGRPSPPPASPFSTPLGQRGSSLVEMALTLPVILLVLLVTLDLGRAVYAQNVISNAAREGARYGSIAPGDTQGIQTKTQNHIVGLDMNAVIVTVSQNATTVTVTVDYQFQAVTPLAGSLLGPGGTAALQAVSTMTIESSQ